MYHLSSWWYFLNCLVVALAIYNDVFANFRLAKIINDTCDRSYKLKVLSVGLFSCAVQCATTEDCRRFLFSDVLLRCTLYADGQSCVVNGDSTGYSCFIKIFGCKADYCTCPIGYYGDNCTQIASDCKDYKTKGLRIPRTVVLTTIKPTTAPDPFEIPCYFKSTSTGMVILHREDGCLTENFNRSMQYYEEGFGNVPWNRWLGFDKILQIANNRPSSKLSLGISLRYAPGNLGCSTRYMDLSIGNRSSQYTFHADKFIINSMFCGDSIMGSNNTLDLNGRPFSTFDNDKTGANCPQVLGGGYWFANSTNCSDSFATGSEMTEIYWRNTLQDQYISRLVFKLSFY